MRIRVTVLKKMTGTIKIAREGSAWKLGDESWKN